ncbi:MAG: beta-N-acetylhexosaminidase [Bacteroidaceae bacterium]|nr:beta-N-acetylhexosaminidase [Bacteroidaceae bacterium]
MSPFEWAKYCSCERAVKPVVFGISGTALTDAERSLFTEHNPLGFILFARNIQSKEQLKALTADLHTFLGNRKVMILVDQEGGRVQRLVPPLMPQFPPMSLITAQTQSYQIGNAIGKGLSEYGFNVDCAPVLDLLFDGASSVIGNRSFGSDAETVGRLGLSYAKGLADAGIMPVIKHIPGHGRSLQDTHLNLAVVDASLEQMQHSDFVPFARVAESGLECMAMMSHVIYSAIDDTCPATLSSAVRSVIRNQIGFKGFIISDDICMKGLSEFHSDFSTIAPRMLDNAVDVVLHCNADIDQMRVILESLKC